MILLALLQPAFGTTMVVADLPLLVGVSDAVVLATVGDASALSTDTTLLKDTRLRVDQVLLGDAPGRLVVRQLGGLHDGLTTKLAGDVELQPGQQVVLCLQEQDGYWTLPALGQGVWFVEGTGPSARVHRELAGLDLLELDRDGSWTTPTHSPLLPETLGELARAFGGAR